MPLMPLSKMTLSLFARVFFTALVCLAGAIDLEAATLNVGQGQRHARIEDALAEAQSGDVIAVHELPDGAAYPMSALLVRKARMTFRGLTRDKGARVKVDGRGFNYSGRGSIPRAIFQFDPGADHGVVENFELFNARNESSNGAGVRINQANHVLIRNCDIHDNDMGIMSNGDVGAMTAAHQMIFFCHLHRNGTDTHPGFNHNLYLGGTSVTLHGCEVDHSTTGHNVKSRAHYNRIEYCYIHSSSNREFDLVDGGQNTAAPESHAVLLGNLVVKADPIEGNKAVIHFGQDVGGDHHGTLFLVHNTIVTPYVSPVVELSAPNAGVDFLNNIVWNPGSQASGLTLVGVRDGARLAQVRGACNWMGPGVAEPQGTRMDLARCYFAKPKEAPPFTDPGKGDYRIRAVASPVVNGALPLADYFKATPALPVVPGAPVEVKAFEWFQYRHPWQTEPRPHAGRFDLGAYEVEK